MVWIRLLLLVFLTKFQAGYGVYKICEFPTMDTHLCKAVEVGNSNVSCVPVVDSVDCAIKLRNGEADFAVFTPEESVLFSRNNSINLQAIGEIRTSSLVNDTSAINMVVIVQKDFSGRFNDLGGKKYCHPGVGVSHRLTDYFLKYFERVVLQSRCNPSLSAVEEEINTLSGFFGDSCRPGVWAQTRSVDRNLKKAYSNLCRLCDSVNHCKNNLDATNSYEAALDCVTKRSGEVAYVPLEEVKNYFGLKPNLIKKSEAQNYVFLCKNETTMSLYTDSPCIWGKQPWDLMVTRSEVSAELKDLVNRWLTDPTFRQQAPWMNNFKSLLLQNFETYVPISTDPVPINSYVDRGGVDDVKDDGSCRSNIRWCTISNLETEKCNWLSQAASTHGFKPGISCIQEQNIFSCFQKIAQNRVDAASIYTEYGYIAKKVFNLATVVYEDNYLDGNYQILAVMKKDNQNIKSFKQLRGKRACFPEYNGLAWISFINMANIYQLLGRTCPEYFFGPSCVPGAYKHTHTVAGVRARPQSMCTICPPTNTSDPCPPRLSVKEKNVNAMLCLSTSGDIAFVNYKALLSGGDSKTLDERINADLYQVMCKNGTVVPGIAVDDNCALSTGINAEVIGRNRPYWDGADTSELFLELNKAFGTIGPGSQGGVIRMFDDFQGEKKVLFKETTITLVNSDEDQFYDQIQLYNSLINNVTGTCKGSAHYTTLLSFELLITSILAWFFVFYL